MKKQLNVTFDEEIIKHIDKKRGLVPLSTFINEILREWYKKEKKNDR